MKQLLASALVFWVALSVGADAGSPMRGTASWYGEIHRGKLMANGQRFNPDQLTAASWFYPLGTKVRVILQNDPQRTVLVTITDRGPARRLVREGRVIDLANAAFKQLADPDLGLIAVRVVPLDDTGEDVDQRTSKIQQPTSNNQSIGL
jgi:rare lipoprotein A